MADDSDPHALTRLLGDAPDPAESVDEQRTRRAVLAGLFGAVEEPTMIDRYALERRVGHGGLGVVYAARDPKLGRRVAIKLVPIQPGGNPDRVAREARALAALVHPNVVAVHDVGAYEHGAQSGVFIVMDLVEGQDLAQWLATSRTWQERAQVFIQAGRGLEAAHRVGMVHRDFKPGNVLIGDDGRVCVVDFGLARAADSAAEPTLDPGLDKSSAPIRVGPMTEVGSVMGTPRYMAPEQHLGEPVDARTDVYSYCASLYEALSGQPAFTQDSIAELLAAKRAGPPRPASSHPAWLWRLVAEGMQPDPDDRPASMTELLSALEQGMRPKRRWGRAAAVTLGVAGLVGLGVATLTPERVDPKPERSSAASASSLKPEVPKPDPALAELMRKGVAALESKHLDEAEEHFKAARALAPHDAHVHFHLAMLMSWRERSPDVVDGEIQLALAGELSEAERITMEGWRHYVSHDLPAAEKSFSAALALAPTDRFALYGMFEARFHRGRIDDALVTWRSLRAAAPRFSLGVMHVLEHCALRRDLACIEAELPLVATQDRMTSEIWRARHRALDGDLAGAIEILEDYGVDAPERYFAELELRLLYLRAGRLDDASTEDPRFDGLPPLAVAQLRRDEDARAAAMEQALAHAMDHDSGARSPVLHRWLQLLALERTRQSPDLELLHQVGQGLRSAGAGVETANAGVGLAQAFLAAADGDRSGLLALQDHARIEVRYAAKALAIESEDPNAASVAWREAAHRATTPWFATLASFEQARVLRFLEQHHEVITVCRQLLEPGVTTWGWAGAARPCIDWSIEAARAVGDESTAQKFSSRRSALLRGA